jgi:hypothetical protein
VGAPFSIHDGTIACLVLAGTAASGDEVNDERDHGEEDQQMNKKAADMHHEEAADPKHSQNDCED